MRINKLLAAQILLLSFLGDDFIVANMPRQYETLTGKYRPSRARPAFKLIDIRPLRSVYQTIWSTTSCNSATASSNRLSPRIKLERSLVMSGFGWAWIPTIRRPGTRWVSPTPNVYFTCARHHAEHSIIIVLDPRISSSSIVQSLI